MAFGTPPFIPHWGDQVPASMGVVGTLGTSDTGGTAQVLPFAVDPVTGAAWNKEIGTPSVNINSGTINVGTFNNTGTNVNVVTGTINLGTFNNTGTFVNISTGSLVGTILGGTIQNIVGGTILNTGTVVNIATGSVVGTVTNNMNSGTLNVGTVVIPSGTINVGTFTNLGTNINVVTGSLVGTVSVTVGTVVGPNASAGTSTTAPVQTGGTTATGTVYGFKTDINGLQHTLQESGTTTVVSNLTNGSVNILSGSLVGTVLGGTIQNLNAGTVTLVSTVTTVSNLTNGSVILQSGTLSTGTLQNLVTGTINALASGTITGGTLQNLNAGTITVVSNLTNGSVNVLTGTQQLLGTLQLGTVQQLLPPNISQTVYGTFGTTGALVFGTLAGGTSSGAGTEIFITGCSIVIPANSGSQDISIGFGTNAGALHNGTGVLARGFFVAGGGISRQFNPPVNSGTNAQVTLCIGGAGTVEANISYFTTASTL